MMKNKVKNNVFEKMTIGKGKDDDDDDNDDDEDDLGLVLPKKDGKKKEEELGEAMRQLRDENGR